MLTKTIGYFLAALLLMTSCGSEKKENGSATSADAPTMLANEEALAVYQLYLKGDYNGLVGCIQSCDDKPEAYRQQMAILYKQHAADQKEDDGDVVDAQIARIQPQSNGHAAEVFVNVTYETGKTEEVLLQFVHDGKSWRLR